MSNRLGLQVYLEAILGSANVYFQPPPSFKMLYPCIVYTRSKIETDHANNKPYGHKDRYSVTVIDRDPDSLIPGLISDISTAAHDRHYVYDNLNHDVFTLYY